MSDSDLVQALRQRDSAAFQRICDRHLPSLWRYVYARVDGDQHVAEDIVSETLLALVQAASPTEEPTVIVNLGGWLRTVATRKTQDYYRALARVRHLLDQARHTNPGVDVGSDPAQLGEAEERRGQVRQTMEQLSDQHRIALEWKYLDKLSVREIAERFGATEKAAESILFRARREFRQRLSSATAADNPTPETQGGDPPDDQPPSDPRRKTPHTHVI